MPGAQGGTYAAPVWHAFMLPAHGDDCDDFPLPTEPFESSPFFGKYSSTGGSSTDDDGYGSGDDGTYTESPDTATAAPTTTRTSTSRQPQPRAGRGRCRPRRRSWRRRREAARGGPDG